MVSRRSIEVTAGINSEDVADVSDDVLQPFQSRPRILFASSAEQPAAYSLSRALALADGRGARLHVLRVLPRPSLLFGVLAPFLHNDDLRQVTDFVGAARASSSWYARVLGERFSEEHASVTVGNFDDEVVRYARAVSARMIVIPAGEWPGSTITAIARRSRLPVLVVREVDHAETVIAATDLGADGLRILEQAAKLGQQLEANVIALHNVPPSQSVEPNELALTAFAHGSAVPTSVITRRASHVEGILAEARALKADTVVVGTRLRSRLAQVVRRSVAVQVIDGARRSVLVLPIGARSS